MDLSGSSVPEIGILVQQTMQPRHRHRQRLFTSLPLPLVNLTPPLPVRASFVSSLPHNFVKTYNILFISTGMVSMEFWIIA